MARLRPNLHRMVSRWARIQVVLKVKFNVKDHVIWALLWWHENRFFSQANSWIATKLAHYGLQVSMHPGCAQARGQRSCDIKVTCMWLIWLHKNHFFHANGCILIKLSLFVTFPSLRTFRFLPLPNAQMAESSLCELRNSSQFTHR